MHKEILTEEQIKLLPLITEFGKGFGLVGGTAVAFHLGHRRSIDFDLFTGEKFGNQGIMNKISKREKIDMVIVNQLDELTLVVRGVRLTFFRYPYEIVYSENLPGVIGMPSLLTLSAMKAFALGMRAKWKDFVDLYFILKDQFSISQISQQSKQIFGSTFNEKLFRNQLAYFNDINYSEAVEFMPGFEVEDEIVRKKLLEFSLE